MIKNVYIRKMRKKVSVIFCICLFLISASSVFSASESKQVSSLFFDSNDFETSLVLLCVDENLTKNSSLFDKICRYEGDIQNSLNVRTQMIIVNSSWSTNKIQSVFQEKFDTEKLVGSVLIGNVSVPFYDYYPSVYPYSNLDGTYGSDIWIGIIRPPIYGAAGISLLHDYFDRNHKFHTGSIMFNKECVIASTYESGQVLSSRVQKSGRWDEDRVIGNDTDDETWKQIYLNSITKSAEVIHFHGHGNPNHHLPDIWYTDIIDHPPNAALVYLQSCTTGKFTEKNYIGGWYLFAGNTLAVVSFSSPVWGFRGSGWGEGDNAMQLLSFAGGSCIGQSIVSSHPLQETMVLLGDPTLQLSLLKSEDNQSFTSDVGPIVLERKNTSVQNSWYLNHILSADFNDDGNIDIISKERLYLNKGMNQYHPFFKTNKTLPGLRPDAVDFDDDGDVDVVSAGESIQIFLNNGNASFELSQTIDVRLTNAVVANDFNGDGKVDIIASNESGKIFLYKQHGDGFVEKELFTFFNQPYGMVSFDFDDDGDFDCVIGDKAGYLNILENKGYAEFSLRKITIGGYDYHGLATGDFNDDGYVDLFIKGTNCNYKIVYNDGQGGFSATESIIDASDVFLSFGVAADDFDNDGLDDILYTHYDGVHFKKNMKGFSNHPPTDLRVAGESQGKAGKEYEYTLSAFDTDDDRIYYYVDWGDGSSGWFGPFVSGQTITVNHTWVESKTYLVEVKAVDECLFESSIQTIEVSMPKNKLFNLFFNELFEKFWFFFDWFNIESINFFSL